MSIDATELITKVSGLLSRDVMNEQNKKIKASVQLSSNFNLNSNVNLSQNIALLHSAENDIDMGKIEKIKQAIADGKLVINPDKIADEIIKQVFR